MLTYADVCCDFRQSNGRQKVESWCSERVLARRSPCSERVVRAPARTRWSEQVPGAGLRAGARTTCSDLLLGPGTRMRKLTPDACSRMRMLWQVECGRDRTGAATGARERVSHAGTHFTCFTSTKVQILTHVLQEACGVRHRSLRQRLPTPRLFYFIQEAASRLAALVSAYASVYLLYSVCLLDYRRRYHRLLC